MILRQIQRLPVLPPRSFSAPPPPKTHLTPTPVQHHWLGQEATIPSNFNRFNTDYVHSRLSATRERHPWSPAFSTQQHPNRVTRPPRPPATELRCHDPFGSWNVLKLQTGSLDTRYPPQLEGQLEFWASTSPLFRPSGSVKAVRIAGLAQKPEHFPPLHPTTPLKLWRLCASPTAPG